ncbi:OmpA family protein [Granulicella arctica]|uniref:Outer membrane protein OmpA-like peptidoglycan-associated protein n=1 Tax=Granulicella arctica TaxID=940613 RepID=A0A7Y9PHE2_9BACT|nr:OmpA family protein [Granulicella arctica]NYF79173.1 outer membrane protein OmpA-like peptidoglycan-associated protein [Granulicella arctica]
MMKHPTSFGLSVLLLGGALSVTSLAQSSASSTPTDVPPPAQSMSPDNTASYATGKPLETQSKEGFWGHMNPLARKRWVKRQIDPIKDRDNELDQLQAKNANDIRDVDTRSQAGISKAMMAANTADQHAQDAANRANAADTLAGTASTKTDALHGTVSNLDQYQTVTSSAVPFASGRTTLGPKAKSDLDDLAAKLGSEKGYILEVQGYSRAGVPNSQAMADSVVRYLVTEHQVPIYRIYRTGLGHQKDVAVAEGDKPVVNGVRVTLLHNSLATMDSPGASGNTSSLSSGTANPSSN